MVWESIVVEVLNRVLGKFIENLDSSQFQLGIWGGDVLLKDLELKQTALNDLGLPIQTVYGYLGKLIIQIPWTNIYNSSVIAHIEKVYLLAEPNIQVKYDIAKEEAKLLEIKRKEIEEFMKKKSGSGNERRPSGFMDTTTTDGFLGNLILQVFRNIKIQVSDVHIRYEDVISNPRHFAVGVTLKELRIESAYDDEISKTLNKVFKITYLDCLGCYWNVETDRFKTDSISELHTLFQKGIGTRERLPKYSYVAGPIYSEAYIRVSTKPTKDLPPYSVPLFSVQVDLTNILVQVTTSQYQSVILLIESLVRMQKGLPYRKYRPFLLTYKGHYKIWWYFAYECIVNCEIRRARDNWDWSHIKYHRKMCKTYEKIYFKKMMNYGLSNEDTFNYEHCEIYLDLINIQLIQIKVDIEIAALKQRQRDEAQSSSYASRFVRWVFTSPPVLDQPDLTPQDKTLFQLMIGDTKQLRLKSSYPPDFVTIFVAVDIERIELRTVYRQTIDYITLRNSQLPLLKTVHFRFGGINLFHHEKKINDVAKMSVINAYLDKISVKAEERGGASSITIMLLIQRLDIIGKKQQLFIPTVARSHTSANSPNLVDMIFCFNPLSDDCKQSLVIKASSIEIIYDAETVDQLIEVFTMPSTSTGLIHLEAEEELLAMIQLNKVKQMTASGIQYVLHSKEYFELIIDLEAPFFIIPSNGIYKNPASMLIIDLGHLNLTSESHGDMQDIETMVKAGLDQEEIYGNMVKFSYDIFHIEITAMQVLFILRGEEWRYSLQSDKPTMHHVIEPMHLSINVKRCIIEDDPSLPLLKIESQLEYLKITCFDSRMIKLLIMLTEFPYPNFEENVEQQSTTSAYRLPVVEEQKPMRPKPIRPKPIAETKIVQLTKIVLLFAITEIGAQLLAPELSDSYGFNATALEFCAKNVEFSLTMKTFMVDMSFVLRAISLCHYRRSDTIYIFKSTQQKDYLIVFSLSQHKSSSPLYDAATMPKLSIRVDFSSIEFTLHHEGISELLLYYVRQLDKCSFPMSTYSMDSISSDQRSQLFYRVSDYVYDTTFQVFEPLITKQSGGVDRINLKVTIKMRTIQLFLKTIKKEIAAFGVHDFSVYITLLDSNMNISVVLNNIAIDDKSRQTCYRNILSIIQNKALKIKITIYHMKLFIEENAIQAINVIARLGCIKLVYLNYFVISLLEYCAKFQNTIYMLIEKIQGVTENIIQNTNVDFIKLDIHIIAPIVVLPLHSTSFTAAVFDFGFITITNELMEVEVSNNEINALIDSITVTIEEIAVYQMIMSRSLDFKNNLSLVEPLSFIAQVKRNLSSSWYTGIPDISIVCKLETIQVSLNQTDFGTITEIITQNFSEMDKRDDSTWESMSHFSKSSMLLRSEQKSKTKSFQSLSFKPKSLEKPISVLQIGFKIMVCIGSISLQLFVPKNEKRDHNPDDCLALFKLYRVTVDGSLTTDGAISGYFFLGGCTLDDKRPGKNKIFSRFIDIGNPEKDVYDSYAETIPVSEDEVRNNTDDDDDNDLPRCILTASYHLIKNCTLIDINVSRLSFLIEMVFIQSMLSCFTTYSKEVREQMMSKRQIRSPYASSIFTQSLSKISISDLNKTLTDSNEIFTLMNVKISRPDIMIIETLDDLNTNAIVLNFEVGMRVSIGCYTYLTGMLKELHLYTCTFNEKYRESSKSTIVNECNVDICGSTPIDEGLHIDFYLENVRIIVSPGTMDIISTILAALSNEASVKLAHECDYIDTWKARYFSEDEFWFLKSAEETDSAPSFIINLAENVNEFAAVLIPSFVVSFEMKTTTRPMAVLLLELSFEATVHNWSSSMYMESSLRFQMAYYNSDFGLWEPLIEPVELSNEYTTSYDNFEINAEVRMVEIEEKNDNDLINNQTYYITVSSLRNLEITVSKTCLTVINEWMTAMDSANPFSNFSGFILTSPYAIQNDTDLDVKLILHKSKFKSVLSEGHFDVILEPGAQTELTICEVEKREEMYLIKGHYFSSIHAEDVFLKMKVEMFNCEINVPMSRTAIRYFPFHARCPDSNLPTGIIADIKIENSVAIATLRSTIQIFNHFLTDIEIFYQNPVEQTAEFVCKLEGESMMNVPFYVVYGKFSDLYFRVPKYATTLGIINFVRLLRSKSRTQLLACDTIDKNLDVPFYIMCSMEIKEVYYENSVFHTTDSISYILHVQPAKVLYNYLPVEIKVLQNLVSVWVEPGEMVQMPNMDPASSYLSIKVNHLQHTWSCFNILPKEEGYSVWSFESHDGSERLFLDLGMHTVDSRGTLNMSLYCPFWMVNKTGLCLSYMKTSFIENKTERDFKQRVFNEEEEVPNIIYHPPFHVGPVLLSYRPKHFFDNKTAQVRVNNGSWSRKFSLDTPGSFHVIGCQCGQMYYKIGIAISMIFNSLSKRIILTPHYIIINETKMFLECEEDDIMDEEWIQVAPEQCAAFWPKNVENGTMRVRCLDMPGVTTTFQFCKPDSIMLALKNKLGGVYVDIQEIDQSIYIALCPYVPDLAPVLIINNTDMKIALDEKGSSNQCVLLSDQCKLFTWFNPSGDKLLSFNYKGTSQEFDIRKDATGVTWTSQPLYWSCFLDGLTGHRVLLFSFDKNKVKNTYTSVETQKVNHNIVISLSGIGISIVNNAKLKDIMYICISGSGVLWEIGKMDKHTYKELSKLDSEAIEKAFTKYVMAYKVPGHFPKPRVVINNRIEVDFEKLIMIRPYSRKLRRIFRAGLWCQIKISNNLNYIRAKINHLQIDNQLSDSIYRVVLSPVRPPRTVAVIEFKPFAELSIVQKYFTNSTMNQFIHYQLLVQEFHIKLDFGLLSAMLDVIEVNTESNEGIFDSFRKDIEYVEKPLTMLISKHTYEGQKDLYDLIHFSPLKVHVSFTMTDTKEKSHKLVVLLHAIGVTLTEMNDVVFKLQFFERKYLFLSKSELYNQVLLHYVSEALKQLYIVVLGLDFIGNPVGLVVGISRGVTDLFYEPYQGALQGPTEFGKGIVTGAKNFFGRTIGGTFGAVSRITGALGTGFVALSLNSEYRTKRLMNRAKPMKPLHEGLVRSGGYLVMSFMDGITGLITHPLDGLSDKGVPGFFKGLGTGALGLFFIPISGVFDFTSCSLATIEIASQYTFEVDRLRPPRLFRSDGLMQPYCRRDAEGNKFLKDLDRGRFEHTDMYIYHEYIIPKKSILILTNERAIYAVKHNIIKVWKTEWTSTWHQIVKFEDTSKGLVIHSDVSKSREVGQIKIEEKVLHIPQDRRQFIMNTMMRLRSTATSYLLYDNARYIPDRV